MGFEPRYIDWKYKKVSIELQSFFFPKGLVAKFDISTCTRIDLTQVDWCSGISCARFSGRPRIGDLGIKLGSSSSTCSSKGDLG